jgi:hypothetical protein
MGDKPIGWRLEQYTLKRPQEVLLVKVEIGEETDEIAIFRGFSSSLVRSTPFDPDVPMLPEDVKVIAIDRLQGPYNPQSPRYLQRNLTLKDIQILLSEAGV